MNDPFALRREILIRYNENQYPEVLQSVARLTPKGKSLAHYQGRYEAYQEFLAIVEKVEPHDQDLMIMILAHMIVLNHTIEKLKG